MQFTTDVVCSSKHFCRRKNISVNHATRTKTLYTFCPYKRQNFPRMFVSHLLYLYFLLVYTTVALQLLRVHHKIKHDVRITICCLIKQNCENNSTKHRQKLSLQIHRYIINFCYVSFSVTILLRCGESSACEIGNQTNG